MTNEDCDTVAFAGMTKLVVLCGHAKLTLHEIRFTICSSLTLNYLNLKSNVLN